MSDLIKKHIWLIEAVCIIFVAVALGLLAARAWLRLEVRWDNFAYHLPYAAIRGGISIPFQIGDNYIPMFQGFPPLAAFLQGMLWRISGNMHATGVVNYVAFLCFLLYCHIWLKARFWLVALIALTAPLVILHSATGYDDLLANSLLAIGCGTLVRLSLFPETDNAKQILIGGLIGLAGAAWTKFMVIPVDGVVFVVLWVICDRQRVAFGWSRRRMSVIFLCAGLIATAPYIKNIVLYHNPFWPYQLPVFSQYVPYAIAPQADIQINRPRTLVGAGQFWVYLNSLFEINHPTHYDFRPRWILDQGTAYVAYRAGGFWNIGVVTFMATTVVLLLKFSRTKIRWLPALAFVWVIAFVGILPQSNELRYYLFMPLLWATIIAMLYPRLKDEMPVLATGMLALFFGMFCYMAWENSEHYAPMPNSYMSIAKATGIDKVWPVMEKGKTYCAIDVDPLGIFLTGPTMSEYKVTAVTRVELCPDGSTGIAKPDILSLMKPGTFDHVPQQ